MTAVRRAAYILAVVLALGGCGSSPGQPGAGQRLRITNVGSTPIASLTVLFPADQVRFGDLPIGATSRYVEVPNGVYAYAAYNLSIDGTLITQPVIDWVGEVPMEGEAFTYSLDVDPRRPQFAVVRLMGVTRDE